MKWIDKIKKKTNNSISIIILILLGLAFPATAHADESKPEIVTRVLINGQQFDDFKNLEIDKSVAIDIMIKKYYDISWLISDYKISVCNIDNGCTNNFLELIPLNRGYEQNSLLVNEVKIVRTNRSRFTLYFLKTGTFEVNISAIYLRVENPYATQPMGWDDCSVKTCFSTSTGSLRLNVKSAVSNSRDINNFLDQKTKLESKLTCPEITESQKYIECTYKVSYAIDKKFWADYGITKDSEAVLSGKVNSSFCSTSYKEYRTSNYGKCREKPEFVGATPLEFFIKEVTLNEENKIRFKNQYKQQDFCLLSETFTSAACYNKQRKSKYSASQLYRWGKEMVLNSSQEALARNGFLQVFGATGKPVKSKVESWCSSFSVPGEAADKNYTKGCVDAAMTLYRK